MPIILDDAEPFGSLCAFDLSPGEATDERLIRRLQLFADIVAQQISDRKLIGQLRASFDAQKQDHLEDKSQLQREQALGARRETLFAIVSHDLRTPLGSIAAGCEILKHSLRSAGDLEVIDRLQRSVARMTDLVDDLVDLTRVQKSEGIGAAIRELAGIDKYVRNAVEELRQAHSHVGLQLMCEGCEDLKVDCDVARIEQMISNLVRNAIEHGDTQQVIRVHVSGSPREVVFRVHNSGAPIAAELREFLFNPFRSHRPAKGRKQGLGLGLFIVASIAHAHAGTVALSSNESGTEFCVRIPTRQPGTA